MRKFSINDIVILNADSFEILPKLVKEKCKYDLIVLDPPYVRWEGEINFPKIDFKKLALYIKLLLDERGVVAWFGKQPEMIKDYRHFEYWFEPVNEFILLKKRPTMKVIYTQPTLAHENLWIMKFKKTATTETNINWERLGYVKKKRKRRIGFRIRRTKHEGIEKLWRGYPTTVITRGQIIQSDKEYIGHPTQKPLQLIIKIIIGTTPEKARILDPFLGSGTTAVAAYLTKRTCLGIEILPEFYKMAVDRLKRVVEYEKYFVF